MCHGPQCCVGIKWIAQYIAIHNGHCFFNKLVKHSIRHINAFYAATTLTRIKHRTINQRVSRRLNIGITHHIARIFAAKFKPKPGKTACRRLFNGPATSDRPSEIHKAK